MFHVVFHEPKIPPNTGNAIRMVAATGCTLHLIEPLGFDLTDAKLRRAGLDYHDLANVEVHPDFDTAIDRLRTIGTGAVHAFTGRAAGSFSELRYRPGDALLFGTEPTGLPEAILDDPRVTSKVRIPMLPGVRSLNLSNSAAVAVYEAWRQHEYLTGPTTGPAGEGAPG